MNNGSAPWIKIITRIFEDPKIIAIQQLPDGDGILVIWFKLLALAGEQNRGGSIYFTESVPFSAELLAMKWRSKSALVQFALSAFEKFSMITIDHEGTIFISNWVKYQNEEGLSLIRERGLLRSQEAADKVTRRLELAPVEREQRAKKTREQSSARVRRYRERQRLNGKACNAALQPLHVLHGVTRNEAALGDVTAQNQNKNQMENCPSIISPGEIETKRWLNGLFGRTREWTAEEDDLLKGLLPIAAEDRELLQWAYSLRTDAEGWALVDGDRVSSKHKQKLISLLREFPSELDKWRLVRKQRAATQEAEPSPMPAWTEQRREAAYALYGEGVNLACSFHQLPPSVQREIDERIAQSAAALLATVPVSVGH